MRHACLLLFSLAPILAAASGPDLESLCLDCHRPDQTRGEVPLIEGQERDYLRNQLARFRDRHRDGFPMTGVAAGLDDAALALLAGTLSARPWQPARPASVEGSTERGRERTQRLACAECHGEAYLGIGDIPRLAGQQPGYLARQIRAFATEQRHHPPSGIGARMYVLEDGDADDIAAFLHGLDAQR